MIFRSEPGIIQRMLLQSVCVVLIACLLGVGLNLFRSQPLALVQDWSAQARLADENGDSMSLDIMPAGRHHQNQTAVFIDARDPGTYALGHIDGALNLPWHQVQEKFMAVAPVLDPDRLIITYCDGETCSLSHDLAFFLKEMGFRVKVMTQGWQAWVDAGMPVSSHSDNSQGA